MQPLIVYMVLVGCYTAIPALCSLDTAGCAVQGGTVYQVELAGELWQVLPCSTLWRNEAVATVVQSARLREFSNDHCCRWCII